MKTARIIVLAGQSNAVGVGHCAYLTKHCNAEQVAKYRVGYETVPVNYFSHDHRSGGFVATKIGDAESSQDTFGPEVGIAQWLTEHPQPEPHFIVKCAVGATSLLQDWHAPEGWLYQELVKILKESIMILESQGYTPVVQAFCWMQGESDTCDEAAVSDYIGRYDGLLSAFKSEFAPYLEDCVYVDAGISEIWPFYTRINEAKAAYAGARDRHLFIDTIAAGLTTKHEPEGAPDIYHYDSDCVLKLGKLFAQYAICPPHNGLNQLG